jgi:hypothetical protein
VDIIFKFEATEKFTGGSDAYVRQVKGPVRVKGKEKEVAALRLPAGHWVVTAKAVMQSLLHDGSEFALTPVVRTRLWASELTPLVAASLFPEDHAVNSLTDVTATGAGQPATEAYHFETTALVLGVDFRSGGYVQLSAETSDGAAFSDIVISAIRVNSLTVEAG